MPKLKKFKNQNEKKVSTKNLFIAFGIILMIMGGVIISKSYAIYKLEKKYDIIQSKIGSYSMGDVRVAVMVDGEETSQFPSYETNYKVEKVECTNGVNANFDVKNWQINIADMRATSTKCTIYFNSKETNSETPIAYSKEELIAINESLTDEFQAKIEKNILDKTYPVGSIYMSTTEDTVEKVQSKFGGTWVKYSEGRTLIGVGTTTDSNSESKTFAVNETGGEYNHKLTTAEIPSHSHIERFSYSVGPRELGYGDKCGTDVSGSPVYMNFEAMLASYGLGRCSGDATKLTTSSTGGKGNHNNISPYTAVYMYKRTA